MKKTKMITRIGMLSAIATILMYIEFPLLPSASFLKFDFSEVPVFLASFSLGPIPAVFCALIKNIIHILSTKTGGVGEIANFILSCALCVPAGIMYIRNKTKKNAIISIIIGSLSMVILSIPVNYFINLPLYGIPFEGRWPLIVSSIIPFNSIKVVIIGLVTLFIYKPLSRFIKSL